MTHSVFDMITMQHLWSTPELREIFSERARHQAWLDFEVALAQAQAELNIIPEAAARDIEKHCNMEGVDLGAVAAHIRQIKHPLVPLLKQVQKKLSKEGAEFLHYGATTQDAVDTGLMLQLKRAHDVYLKHLAEVGRELIRLSTEHRDTVMVGRTHGVQALPITFGHKCAIWLDEVGRHIERLEQAGQRVFALMMVGAVGSQASYGPEAREIERRVADKLGLTMPNISWAPARDRPVEYTSLLALIAGTMGKIGNELFNMQRNEMSEVEEGFDEGKLGSSTMPHKRNPSSAENISMLYRSIRYSASMMLEAMVQEHERDAVAWKSEFKALPEICMTSGAIMFQTANLLRGLRINKERMKGNTEMMQGYLLSERVMLVLGEKVGKSTAHEWIYEASMYGIENGKSFYEALRSHQHIGETFSAEEIADLTRPEQYLGEIGASIDRVVQQYKAADWFKAS